MAVGASAVSMSLAENMLGERAGVLSAEDRMQHLVRFIGIWSTELKPRCEKDPEAKNLGL
jgi:hypothetical protein